MFDFVRGVDALIWTVILARAFGPGPLTGALAILVTDTGTFGKIFSEALENVDQKQIEGVQSTGANAPQRYRFGVIPQVTPVLLSQLLYFLESNTRSATVIGAITGGGIGLLADAGDHHPERLGRGRLLHCSDHPDGDADGLVLGLAAQATDPGGNRQKAQTTQSESQGFPVAVS